MACRHASGRSKVGRSESLLRDVYDERSCMKPRKLLTIAAAGFAVFVIIVVAGGAGWNPTGVRWNFTNSGQFGDSFGFLSSFMAAAAAFAAWAAYRLQHEEIAHLRASDVASRELEEKRDFEQTFFNLLELFRDVVKEIDVTNSRRGITCQGRDALAFILEEIDRASKMEVAHHPENADANSFMRYYNTHRDDLAHYFRLFYHIVKYVDESTVERKKIYIRLIRATLSNAEMSLIALDCMYGGGRGKLKPLVEKYQILHNISQASITRWGMLGPIGADAFGDRSVSASAQM
jgi:hypothetical protein